MKAQYIPGDYRFQPVSIMLTFETKEEFDVIENMTGHDVTISDLIVASPSALHKDLDVIKKFFSEIYWALDAAGNVRDNL